MKVCCFTGHRPAKFSFKYNEKHPDCIKIKTLLSEAIKRAVEMGYDTFVSGMAIGVDTCAAEAVVKRKANYPYIKLEAAILCIQQEKVWPKASQERYQKILQQADIVTYVSKEPYAPKLMIIRNIYMVDKSSLLIAVFDGSKGGTKHTFDYAKQRGIDILHIHPEDLLLEHIEAKPEPLEEYKNQCIYHKDGK